MEHSSLIAAFSIPSLREHFYQPFRAPETLIEASTIPTFSTGRYGLKFALPFNFTAANSGSIAFYYFVKLFRAITVSSRLIIPVTQTNLIIIILATCLLGVYLFSYRQINNPSDPTKRLTPSHRWSECPFPLIHATITTTSHRCSHYSHHAAQLMAATHNTILRGLNAVYAQSFYVRPGTKTAGDLLTYCSAVLDFLHHHHEIEERIFFPSISNATGDPSFSETNLAQHRAFESGLEALHLYTTTTPPACFSAHTLRGMIESFAPGLAQHLHDEIPSIMSLHNKMPSKTLRQIYQKMLTAAERESDPFITAPFVMGCQDPYFLLDGESFQFPEHPLPLPLIKFLVHWVISWRHRGLWRFNPSTLYGEPRRTAFCSRG